MVGAELDEAGGLERVDHPEGEGDVLYPGRGRNVVRRLEDRLAGEARERRALGQQFRERLADHGSEASVAARAAS